MKVKYLRSSQCIVSVKLQCAHFQTVVKNKGFVVDHCVSASSLRDAITRCNAFERVSTQSKNLLYRYIVAQIELHGFDFWCPSTVSVHTTLSMNDIGGRCFQLLAEEIRLDVDHTVEKVVAANVTFNTTAHGQELDYSIEQNSVKDAFYLLEALKVLKHISNLKLLLTLERPLSVDASLDDMQRKEIQIFPDYNQAYLRNVFIDSEYKHAYFSKKITLP